MKMRKSKEEKKRDKVIIKKIDIYSRCNSKDILKSKFIGNMREYLLEKFSIEIKEEKQKFYKKILKIKWNLLMIESKV